MSKNTMKVEQLKTSETEKKTSTDETQVAKNGTHKFDEPWQEQKLRMDRMIDNLKRELKEVQTMDKHLTKQFIVLGGQINKLKTTNSYFDDMDECFAEENSVLYEADTEEQDQYDTKF